jgi:hypothetical protein
MLKELGLDISGAAVARRYLGIIDAFVIDAVDTLSEGDSLSSAKNASRSRQRVLVMEPSEDRVGAHNVGLSAAMTGCRSRYRSNRRIGNPRTQRHI